uniref:Ribonuclease PIN domain-containing protein n=1 Tax=Amphimedon queenslandica TaxID=400682 RepID=A0A1X7SZ96_AMPQE
MNKSRVSCLVVDSGPFIKGVALQDWSQTVYTIRDVISEIKDSETRQRLQVLPYELILREPSQEYIKHVTRLSRELSQLTGMDSSLDLTTLVTTGFFQSHPIEVQKAAIVEAARRLGYQLKKEQYEVISSFIHAR